jgi:O-acetyl-ADP-ribose deacetylase (regulator of RNase III)
MEIVLGDICYPKSETMIIPANSIGIMSTPLQKRVVKAGFNYITKEIKGYITNNKVEVGGIFTTGPGKMKRRGLKKIYYIAIKRLQSDFTSVYIVEKALNDVFKRLVADEVKSVSLCGVGIDPGDLDKKSIARITVDVCNKYKSKLDIKIIDDNEEFIKECSSLVENR